jgi:hypothetical protein
MRVRVFWVEDGRNKQQNVVAFVVRLCLFDDE